MNTYKTHVGWLRSSKPMQEMSRQEYEFDRLVGVGTHALLTTINRVTGVTISPQIRSEHSSIIQSPEGRSWWQLDASAVPAIGMPALRRAIGEAYKDIFDPLSSLSSMRYEPEAGVSPELIDEYATALHVVPPEWTRTDQLWVPEAYRPAA